MARIRYLKPDFFKDEDIAALPFWIRILYTGLWVMADKEGRLEDRPRRIKAEIFPYDRVDVAKGLDILSRQKNNSSRPFILRYCVDGERYVQILKWHDHQRPHHTESPSRIPLFNGELTVKQPLSNGYPTPTSSELVVNVNGDGDGEGNGECHTDKPSTIETIEKKARERGVDWEDEIKRMDIWLAKHPHRKKTDRFIMNWMMRADVVVAGKPRRRIVS